MKVFIALFALLAIASAQNLAVIDDFFAFVPTQAATLRISSFADTEVEDFNCQSTAAEGIILGDCHVLHLFGFAASGCEPTASVAQGAMFCNNAFSCAAECTLQLDGSSTTFARTGGLNGRNLNGEGFAFRIFAATDVATDFTIRVYSGSSVSTARRDIPAGSSSSAGNFVQYDINFSDFSNPAAFSSVDTLEIVIPQLFDTDVVLTDWGILSQEADIFGIVFDDCGCDLVKDASDAGAANVVVTLTGDASCPVNTRTTTTNTAGDYSFVGLPPCTYTISIPATTLCSGVTNPRTVVLGSTSEFNVNFQIALSEFFTVPADASVRCNQGTTPGTLGSASSSSCTGTRTVSFTDVISNENCDADFTITRTWTDGVQSGTQVIVVTDTGVGPTLTGVPVTALLDCDADTSVAALGQPNAIDDCSTASVIPSDSPLASTCNPNTCSPESSFTRTFTSQDACGNAGESASVFYELNCQTMVNAPCPSPPSVSVPVPVPGTGVQVPVPVTVVNPVPVASSPPSLISTNRNCRFICDDDDSSASITAISSFFVALIALFAMM